MELGGNVKVEVPIVPSNPAAINARGVNSLNTWVARLRPIVWLAPILCISLLASYALRFDGNLPQETLVQLATVIPLIVAAKTLALLAMRLTLSCHAFVSMHDAFRLLRATFVATATVAAVDGIFLVDSNIPRGVIIIDGCLTALLIGGVLTIRRSFRERGELRRRPEHLSANSPKRVFVAASPSSGELLLRAIRQGRTDQFDVVGILTDVERLQHREIAGTRVLGRLTEIEALAEKHQIEMLLLSSGDLSGNEVRQVVTAGESLGIEVRIVPDVSKIVSGQIDFRPREVAIEDLLGRPQVDIDQSGLSDWLSGKRLLVTGSCGSIGSELVRQLLKFSPEHIALVDRSENGQFHLGRELQAEVNAGLVEIILADVTDLSRMNSIFRQHQPEIVFHAAAYKHVPMLEHHPGEGVKNIIGATKVVADLSHSCSVETFVMISTDKAVNPTSIMGCCKRVAELYVQSMSSSSTCKFLTVRFGNVLGSAGSVIPVFREQIANGGPITVTDRTMTRYFMTIPEASQLVIQAAKMGGGGEIFVLDMGSPIKIIDLAEDMIRLSGLRIGEDISIEITGLRPGEKLYEELYCESEQSRATRHSKILVADSTSLSPQKTIASINSLLAQARYSRPEICYQLCQLVPTFNNTNKIQTKAASSLSKRVA